MIFNQSLSSSTYCKIHRHILQTFAYQLEINYDDNDRLYFLEYSGIQIDVE